MIIRFDQFSTHDDCCTSGQSAASCKASVYAALLADPEIDCESIEIKMLGPIVILTGYVKNSDHAMRALHIAEQIVGEGKVQDRMLHRFFG